jgi:hypothetical protein
VCDQGLGRMEPIDLPEPGCRRQGNWTVMAHVIADRLGMGAGDLPPNFHPAAVRVSGFCTPSGAGGATGDRRSWSGCAADRPLR